jgi:hypothetical protein
MLVFIWLMLKAEDEGDYSRDGDVLRNHRLSLQVAHYR